MKLTVAGKNKEYADGITVAQLVELENVETPQYVTVTVNDEFVESGSFEGTTLKDGDTVEFLYFMGGGSVTLHADRRQSAADGAFRAVSVSID